MEVSETGASNDSQTGPSSQKSESVLEGGESGGYIATCPKIEFLAPKSLI